MLLAQGKGALAKNEFNRVYFEMPGETAPKLAIGYCAEQSGELDEAAEFYNRVAKIDPNNTTACFGLSRCLRKKKDITGSANALNLVPVNHSIYGESRIALAKVLMMDEEALTEQVLQQLSHTISAITAQGGTVHQLSAKVLNIAVKMLYTKKLQENKNFNLLGYKLEEKQLRLGAEAEYRKAAHFAATPEEKIKWVNLANAVRPITLF
jgi:serine/threonine-protein kinase PknG